MGQAVVGQQSKEPGGRRRLWLSKDIFHVLKEKTGTPTVEGIVLDLLETKEVECHPEAFYQMDWTRMSLLNLACVIIELNSSGTEKRILTS
ncbi:hypothetical protein ACFX10_002429 [Malus domestica]